MSVMLSPMPKYSFCAGRLGPNVTWMVWIVPGCCDLRSDGFGRYSNVCACEGKEEMMKCSDWVSCGRIWALGSATHLLVIHVLPI